MDKFYLFVEGTGGFRVGHETHLIAQQEAERLARKEGKRVYILQAIEYCELDYVPVMFYPIEP